MAFTGNHLPESCLKMSRSHEGLKDSRQTKRKKSVARKKQTPPNLKHGKYSKKALQEELEFNCVKRLSGLLELSDEQIQPYINSLPLESKLDQTTVISLSIYLKNINNITQGCSSFSLLLKKKETGENPLQWYEKAEEDMGLNLNFSLSEVKEKQDQIVREHCKALRGNDELKKRKYTRQVMKLERLFCDAARARNSDKEIHLLAQYGSVITNKNYKPLLKLKVVLDMLGLKKDIDKRQYLKGVFSQKNNHNGCKFTPVQVIASPLCILDFLFYLKNDWYKRYGYGTGNNKNDVRELECGLDYYETRAGITCGFVADMVHMCRTSRLNSEFMQLNDQEECVWYLWQSPALKPFRKLIKKARPDIYKQVLKIRREVKRDDRFKEILQRIKLDGEERWRRSEFPMFGDAETDTGAIEFAFIEKPKIYREALKIYEDLRWQLQQKN